MGVWDRKRGEIAKSFRTELHNVVLPLLQLRWPNMVLCRDLQPFDNGGIDLVDVGDGPALSCVVQCKGFDGQAGLEPSHLTQIEHSICTFEESTYFAECYVLLHTKDARSVEAEKKVETLLRALIKRKRIKQYFIWNRQTFIMDCRLRMRELLLKHMRDDSVRRLSSLEKVFRFGNIRVTPVPAKLEVLEFDSVYGGKLSKADAPVSLEPEELRRRAHEMRFSCLLGAFGTGKTTLALQTAVQASENDWVVLFVPAQDVVEIRESQAANVIYRRLVEAARILAHFPSETASEIANLAADSFGALLQNPDERIILCVDGLDEASSLDSAEAMISLVNALGELRCPIILSTRREHFDATFGNFAAAAGQLSPKGGLKRNANIYELSQWSIPQFRAILEQAVAVAEPDECAGLAALRADWESGRLNTELGNLHCHPLFAQMLLHVAATYTALPKDFYRRLIPIWIGAKMARDLRVGRRAATLSEDVHATVGSLLNWMEKVCLLMIRNDSESVKLMDDIEVATIAAVARQDHQLVGFSDTDLLTTTLLVPSGQRSLKPLRACFFHRFFQEYLTARATLRAELDVRVFPDSVTRWITVARKDLAT